MQSKIKEEKYIGNNENKFTHIKKMSKWAGV